MRAGFFGVLLTIFVLLSVFVSCSDNKNYFGEWENSEIVDQVGTISLSYITIEKDSVILKTTSATFTTTDFKWEKEKSSDGDYSDGFNIRGKTVRNHISFGTGSWDDQYYRLFLSKDGKSLKVISRETSTKIFQRK